MTTTDTNLTTTIDTERQGDAAARPVPLFARKLGRPALVVRSGVRAGATESRQKRE